MSSRDAITQRGNTTEQHNNPNPVETFYLTGESTLQPASGTDANQINYNSNRAGDDNGLAYYNCNKADYNDEVNYDSNENEYGSKVYNSGNDGRHDQEFSTV